MTSSPRASQEQLSQCPPSDSDPGGPQAPVLPRRAAHVGDRRAWMSKRARPAQTEMRRPDLSRRSKYGMAPRLRTAQRSACGAVAREQTVLCFAPGVLLPPASAWMPLLVRALSFFASPSRGKAGFTVTPRYSQGSSFSMRDAVPFCAAARLHIRNSSPHHIHHNPSLFLCMEARTSADASARLATTFSVYIPPERFVHLY